MNSHRGWDHEISNLTPVFLQDWIKSHNQVILEVVKTWEKYSYFWIVEFLCIYLFCARWIWNANKFYIYLLILFSIKFKYVINNRYSKLPLFLL